jgi:hypothetical protein
VLYALLTGREPFEGVRGAGNLIVANRLRDLDFHFSAPIPVRLERVLRRAVAKDLRERFSTAGEFAEALRSAAEIAAEPSGVSIVIPGEPSSAGTGDTSLSEIVPAGLPKRTRMPRLIAALLLSAVSFALLTAALLRWLTAK